jgi:chorismate lyase/3-hydroxybenzoate synthase
LGADARRCSRDANVEAVASSALVLLETAVAGARTMDTGALCAGVSSAYAAIGRALAAFDRKPIRFWNYIPDPGDAMGHGLDRYMVFNAGRRDGYEKWNGASSTSARSLATASGVGIAGADLVVHSLASHAAGTPVENPRQRPAWQYSERYGPVAPCFSRATIAVVNGRRILLIGGTASVVGEDSLHEGDVGAQLGETLRNLEALIDAACGGLSPGTALSRLIDLRVYVARLEDVSLIRSVLATRCPRSARLELTIARVCRPELLVEIEGLAHLEDLWPRD